MKRARPYNRESALNAALKLFWRKGYHATSLKDLEGALNMKPGSIYAAFSSKEALFLATLELYFHQHRDAIRTMVQEAETPLADLADYLRELAQKPETDTGCHACMLIKTLLDTTEAEQEIAEKARLYLDQLKAELTAAFERAKSLGELPPEASSERLARHFQSDITALKIEAHRGTDPAELSALAESMAREWEQMRLQPT